MSQENLTLLLHVFAVLCLLGIVATLCSFVVVHRRFKREKYSIQRQGGRYGQR